MIFNNDQLKAQAQAFALTNRFRTNHYLARDFWRILRSDMASLHTFAERLTHSRAECVQPAEDWLLDHIAFLETQFQDVVSQWTRATFLQLPKMQDSSMPRVFAVCEDYLEHVGNHYHADSFTTYVQSYEEVSSLQVIECWALPVAMRVAIIRRLAHAMREVRHRHDVCGSVASLLGRLGAKGLSDEETRALLERETRGKTLSSTEVVHLVRHLSEREPDIHCVWHWLSAYVENNESSLEKMVSLEHQLQAELQVDCGTLVQSLHYLERQPWALTFVEICHVEQILLAETTLSYARLDASSRDVLRGRVVALARQLRVPEALLAQTVVKLAQSRQVEPAILDVPERDTSIAYYLLDPIGITVLRTALCSVTRPRHLPRILLQRRPALVYFLSSILLFLILLFGTGAWIAAGAVGRPLSWIGVLVALAFPVSEWVVTVVHAVIHQCCRPSPLLRYNFSERLPEDARTMVVIPVIWSTVADVDRVVEKLLVHYFANRQERIHFAILADYTDSETQTQTSDTEILTRAVTRITELRCKYGVDKFHLFHRCRRYNPVDNVYMGWERKRGKLVEFVELLSGSESTSFTTALGRTEILADVRYVFTVDYDTRLPIGVVSRMAGTIHFPYNRPRLNQAETRVIEGFGVLQPRIGMSYESSQQSRFSSLWAGEPGIDPYAFAASNPYQDFFGQASFMGKGIFDVDAFRKTLVRRIPDNRVLSHDILEGGFLRAGLTSDIEVVEDHPGTVYAYQRRLHRWIRGDWQLLRWLGKSYRDRNGKTQRIDLCALTRWQIIDNLRRSLISPALLMLAVLGLRPLPGRPLAWEAVILVTLFLPFLQSVLQRTIGAGTQRTIRASFLQGALRYMMLPFSAVLAADAAIRTLYRMFVSQHNLLEWETAAHVERNQTVRWVLMSEPITYITIVLLAVLSWVIGGVPGQVSAVVIFCTGLLVRPVVKQLNRPERQPPRVWLEVARPKLEEWAAQIWSFYDKYVTVEESWLPPDNVQYHPLETIAHRTSPTNIGLYLACVVAARDLELIDGRTMLERLEASMETLKGMEKWHGHLYNWYDTCTAQPLSPRYVSTVDSGNLVAYLIVVRQALVDSLTQDVAFGARPQALIAVLDQIIEETDFKSLYVVDDRLLCLGYHVDTNQRETIRYDLLASEARQASFVAIALGQVPVSHWFTLARTMTVAAGHKTLLSWSGTIFEYLMPSLIMRTYRHSVWDSTYLGVVRRQQMYADSYHVPFGISESSYYAFDYQMNYQYRAFGVPGLGLARGLERNLVVAPYATMMSVPFTGEAGLAALREFERLGAKGEYGFYEAIDFTVGRLPLGRRYEVIQSFMAHHQGMSMLTLTNLLTHDVMVNRFHSDARVRATDLLLQERLPAKPALIEEPIGLHAKPLNLDEQPDDTERIFTSKTEIPEVDVLSNGHLTSVMTNDGAGMLLWNDIAVTRWRCDSVMDSSGVVIYIYDVVSEKTWSATRFPCPETTEMQTTFRLDKAVYEGSCHGIASKLEVTVCPELDAEVRRLQLSNHSNQTRTLEVTSFAELALTNQSADSAHPAFSKLFVYTSHDEAAQCLLAKRRPREENEQPTWAVQTVYGGDGVAGEYEFETDRAAFIGRGHSLENPQAMATHLGGSVGSVADPAFVMRRSIRLAPQESATVYIVTGVAETKEQAVATVLRLRQPAQANRAFHLAWVRAQIDTRHLHLTHAEAATAHQLAGRLLLSPPLSRIRKQAIARNTLGPSGLWSHGVNGDVPMVTVLLGNAADLPFVAGLARQHQYLCTLGLTTNLVVLDETLTGYDDELVHRLGEHLASRGIGQTQRVIWLKSSHLQAAERTLLCATSRVLLRAGGPSLVAQLHVDTKDLPPLSETFREDNSNVTTRQAPAEGEFSNGWGGFVNDGQAYQITVHSGAYLPRPWSNVLANPNFGCILTELGTGYSWWRNSHECKLTPWTNDPVIDRPGECLYLRDNDTQDVWSAAPKPAGGNRVYKVTHGWGFSRFEQTGGDVVHSMETTVPRDDPLKVIRLTLHNSSHETKHLAVTYYTEWVLGVVRETQAPFIMTEWDETASVLFAHNVYQDAFRDAVGFLHITGTCVSYAGDRTEFIGRGGTLARPLALLQGGDPGASELSRRTGIFAESCGAVQTTIDLPSKCDATVIILLGCTSSREEAKALVGTYGRPSAYDDALASSARHWEQVTAQVQVKTPDRAMDILLNGWLLYQTLSCRLWARTAFYQAGGAFGFRDQLQDSLALLHTDSAITRAQILHNAAHQYEEGDVQHWWHEETHKGIRTRFSDDLLWLPYAVSRYMEHTGDVDILQQHIPFLHSEVLKAGELERYEDTVVAIEQGTLLEHCKRAIEHALAFGVHGIPLMGIGDWNDGMNRVGAKGRGESVWLGWFLLDILKRFLQLNQGIVPGELIHQFQQMAVQLEIALNESAWDGAWFRRAFTDGGTWLGSSEVEECRIDAIAQSWSVMSQGTSADRQIRAMGSFDRELVDRDLFVARLLTQAFDETQPSPGYIQGYPPGIRENGGQYTHGVIWSIVAWAMLERRDKAYELFRMLNPILHTHTKRGVLTYGNEPYVMSADVYTAEPHQGRGGWSWYTGAAGWMYQAGLEYVLGVTRRGQHLYIRPCVPTEWESFVVEYRYGGAVYTIEVNCIEDGKKPSLWVVDGQELVGQTYLQLIDDGKSHQVTVRT